MTMTWRTATLCGAMVMLSSAAMAAQAVASTDVGAYDASMAKPIVVKAPVTMMVANQPVNQSAEQVTTVAQGEPQSQSKDDIFDGTEKFAQGASDETNVNLNRGMLGMVTKGKMAGKMDLVVVHTFTYDKPGMYRMEDVEAYSQKLQGGNWNCFIHVRERKNEESTDICSRAQGEMNELVIITAEPKELTFVHVRGKMSLDDLQHWDDPSHSDKNSKN